MLFSRCVYCQVINIMKKKLDLISVVLHCSRILCIRQATFKGGRKLAMATCC